MKQWSNGVNKLFEKLIAIAKAHEPKAGYWGYTELLDALEADPNSLAEFSKAFEGVQAEQLDLLDEYSDEYGWIIGGAADALDLLPDDPRLFISESRANSLEGVEALEALGSACIVNDVEAVKRLASKVDVNSLDHNKQLPLMYAAGNNHPECVRVLLERGADPNKKQNWGNTPMHSCGSKKILQMMIAAGGRIDIPNDDGQTVKDQLKELRRLKWLEA